MFTKHDLWGRIRRLEQITSGLNVAEMNTSAKMAANALSVQPGARPPIRVSRALVLSQQL
jgi:hypothetical protein